MDCTITTMVSSTYSERLDAAMKHAKISTSALSEILGISYQAVKKVLDGKSNALTAENNARASRALTVSSHWLATGEGEMIPSITTANVKFSGFDFKDDEPDDVDLIEGALQALDTIKGKLAPTLQSAGRELLVKYVSGEISKEDALNTLASLVDVSYGLVKRSQN